MTELAKILKPVYASNPLLVWQIIWTNLSFNSSIVNWYVTATKNDIKYTKNELVELLKEDYPNLKGATLKNPVDALVNTFVNSPLGTTDAYADDNLKMGLLEKKELRSYQYNVMELLKYHRLWLHIHCTKMQK